METSPTVRRLLVACLLALLAGSALTGCSGDDSEDSPTELARRLVTAKRSLDEAGSIRLSMRADRMPPNVGGIREATGVITHAPAFRGHITVAAQGLLDGQTVRVVATGGQVFAQMPFTSAFISVDPANFSAPDPAGLMDADTGLSTLLTAATDLSDAGEQRAGARVLTTVNATVPGSAVDRVFPSSAEDQPFHATFLLDEEDRLHHARITGPFYAGAKPVTYDISVAASPRRVEITAP
jgi:lipoprotein LprG